MQDSNSKILVGTAKEPNFTQIWNELGHMIASSLPSLGSVKAPDATLSFDHSKPPAGHKSLTGEGVSHGASISAIENQHPRSIISPSLVSEIPPIVPTNIQSVESLDLVADSSGDAGMSTLRHQHSGLDDGTRSSAGDITGLSNEGRPPIDPLTHSNSSVVHAMITVETRPTASKRASDLDLAIPQPTLTPSSTAICSSPDLGSAKGILVSPCAGPSTSVQNNTQNNEMRVRGSSFRGSALDSGVLVSTSRQSHPSNMDGPLSRASLTPADSTAGTVSSYRPSWGAPRGRFFPRVQAVRHRDALPNEILRRAKALIDGDPVSFFLEYRFPIYGSWVSSLAATAESDPLQRLIAAYDVVISCAKDRENMCSELSGTWPLRFGYVQLVAAVDAFCTESRDERKSGPIAVGAYLEAKGMADDGSMKANLQKLLVTARRFRTLAGVSPIMLSIYSVEADKMVYVPRPYP